MAENKKDKSAEFARDKSAFGKGGSEKGTASQKAQHKHSGTHQPRAKYLLVWGVPILKKKDRELLENYGFISSEEVTNDVENEECT